MVFMVMLVCSYDRISPHVHLFNNNCTIIRYAVDELGNNDCWVFVLQPNRIHSQLHLHICNITTLSLPLKNVYYYCFIS